jgi:UDP-GlcNAc:undecaprenyl-phosphate GlcNAc-1-phosphate transferase
MLNPSLIVAPLSAVVIGLAAIRSIRQIALAVGFVDNPDRRRKLHESPIPLGGGLAVWLATWCGLGFGSLSGPLSSEDGGADYLPAALALASFVTLILGVIDDRQALRAQQKLAGQFVAALILVGAGLRVDAWSCFGVELRLGILAWPATVLGILLVINAFNLIDGMDGFCGSLGVVAALASAFLSLTGGHVGDAVLGLALAGALVAFLQHNFAPARIYLGDAGSMTIGIMISALSIRACSAGSDHVVALAPQLALLLLPLLDLAMAVTRRRLTGRSPFTPDRGHVHHRLSSRLGSPALALGAAVGLAAIGAFGAGLAQSCGVKDLAAWVAIAVAVSLLVGTNTFGAFELRLLCFRAQRVLAPLHGRRAVTRAAIRQECQLHGVCDWDAVWDALVHRLEVGAVSRFELEIDLAAAGETFHGHWSLPTNPDEDSCWSVAHTLHACGIPAGLLRVSGHVRAGRTRYLGDVEEVIRALEADLESRVSLPPTLATSPPRTDRELPVTAPLT